MATKAKSLASIIPNFRHGLFLDVSKIDGRTRLGRTVKGIKDALREYKGEPTIVSEMLIHRIVFKAVRLTLHEISVLKDPSIVESDAYLPMANSLRLDLQALEKMADSGKKAPDLDEYLKTAYSEGGRDKTRKRSWPEDG